MNKRQFKAKAENAFLKANQGANIKITWMDTCVVGYPKGCKAYYGTFRAVADGYRPRVMVASGSDDYVMVR